MFNLKSKLLIVLLTLGLATSVMANDTEEEILMCKNAILSDVVKGHIFTGASLNKAVFLDKKTMIKNKDGSRDGWLVFASTRDDVEAYRLNEGYLRMFIKVDKTMKKYKILASVGYNCNGVVTRNYGSTSDWIIIMPDSLIHTATKTLFEN